MCKKGSVLLGLSVMFCFSVPMTGFAQDSESKEVVVKEVELNPSANSIAEKYIESMKKRSCKASAKKDFPRARRDYKTIFTLVEKRQMLTSKDEKAKLSQHIDTIKKAHFADIKCQKFSKREWQAWMSRVERGRYKELRAVIASSKAKSADEKSQRNHRLKVEKARHKLATRALYRMAIYTDWPAVKYVYKPYYTGGKKRGPGIIKGKPKRGKGKPKRCTKSKCID